MPLVHFPHLLCLHISYVPLAFYLRNLQRRRHLYPLRCWSCWTFRHLITSRTRTHSHAHSHTLKLHLHPHSSHVHIPYRMSTCILEIHTFSHCLLDTDKSGSLDMDEIEAALLQQEPAARTTISTICPPTTRYTVVTTYYRSPTTHELMLIPHYTLLNTQSSPLTTHHSLLSTQHSPFTTHYYLSNTTHSYYSLLTAHYSLLTTHH